MNWERGFILVAMIALAVFIAYSLKQYASMQPSQPATTGPPGKYPQDDAIAAQTNADIGPWWIYFNTPGIYNFGPPMVNTIAPPAMVSPAQPARSF